MFWSSVLYFTLHLSGIQLLMNIYPHHYQRFCTSISKYQPYEYEKVYTLLTLPFVLTSFPFWLLHHFNTGEDNHENFHLLLCLSNKVAT